MECDVKKLFQQVAELNDWMDQIEVDDKAQIVRFCDCAVARLRQIGLVCDKYSAYLSDWEVFNASASHNVSEKSLIELGTYLLIYSRQEHMSGDYGECYVNAFRAGAIPNLIREIARKTERIAVAVADTEGKSGRIGIAGEHFVAAELTRRGYVVSLTSKNTKAIDILVSDKKGNRQIAIQVKACDNRKQSKWKMSESVESVDSSNLYFVFVNMNGGNEPSYYVVPSKYVAYRVKEDYENWYNALGKNGHIRRKTSMRTFEFVNDDERVQYQDAWHLLGI